MSRCVLGSIAATLLPLQERGTSSWREGRTGYHSKYGNQDEIERRRRGPLRKSYQPTPPDPMKSISRQLRQESEEARELVRPILAKRLQAAVEELWEDEQFWEEVQDRFEKGILEGHYPALNEGFSLASNADSDVSKEVLLKIVGTSGMNALLPPVEQPWDSSLYNGNPSTYREQLYGGTAFVYEGERFPYFAKEWISELARVGYRAMATVHYSDGSLRLPTKQRADNSSAIAEPLVEMEDAYPVLFDNSRQVLWLHLQGNRSLDRGYREIRVSDEPVSTDKAILAAVTAMEGRVLDLDHLRAALHALKLPLEEPMWIHWSEAIDELPDLPYQPDRFEEHLRKRGRQRRESVLPGGLQSHQHLDYVLLLLRYYRPDFDNLPQEEKIGLIEHACGHINEFLEALRKLAAFLEYGTPGKRQKSAAKDADRDVRSAIRRDVDGLTYRQIGKEFELPPPKDFEYKGDHPTARQMVMRGRSILERALGKEGWREHIESMRAEAKRWSSLSEVEQEAESMVEFLEYPYEEALRIAKERHVRIERLRAEKQPENE